MIALTELWLLPCPVEGCDFEAQSRFSASDVRAKLRAHLAKLVAPEPHPDCPAAHTVLVHDDALVVDALMHTLAPTRLVPDS